MRPASRASWAWPAWPAISLALRKCSAACWTLRSRRAGDAAYVLGVGLDGGHGGQLLGLLDLGDGGVGAAVGDLDHRQVAADLGLLGLVVEGGEDLERVVGAVTGTVEVLPAVVQAAAREEQPAGHGAVFPLLGEGQGFVEQGLDLLDLAAVDHAVDQVHVDGLAQGVGPLDLVEVADQVEDHAPDFRAVVGQGGAAQDGSVAGQAGLGPQAHGLDEVGEAAGHQEALHEGSDPAGDLGVFFALVAGQDGLAQQRLVELVDPGAQGLAELQFLVDVLGGIEEIVDAVAVEAAHVGDQAAGEAQAQQGGEVGDALGVLDGRVLALAFFLGAVGLVQLVFVGGDVAELAQLEAGQVLAQLALGFQPVHQLGDEAGAAVDDVGDAVGVGGLELLAGEELLHLGPGPGGQGGGVQVFAPAVEQVEQGGGPPAAGDLVHGLGAQDDEHARLVALGHQGFDQGVHRQRVAVVQVLDLEDGGEATGEGGGDLDQPQQRVVPGQGDLHLVVARLGRSLLEALDEGLEPALDPLGFVGELAVEHHLDPTLDRASTVQPGVEAGVDPQQGLQAVFFVVHGGAPEDRVLVFVDGPAAQLAHHGALAPAEGAGEVHDPEAFLAGCCPVGLEGVEVAIVGDVELVLGLSHGFSGSGVGRDGHECGGAAL